MNDARERALIDDILDRALAEDLGDAGDITSRSLFDEDTPATAVIRSNQDGILSGAYLLAPLFGKIDPSLEVVPLVGEGASLTSGTDICRIAGGIRGILAGERTALNFLQRLSGIATAAARYVSRLRGTHARLLDTRKTTPTLRYFEKKAVVAGGGGNHRFGLYDMVLIKDTHVSAAGGVAPAVRKARSHAARNHGIAIEVEVQTPAQFDAAVAEKPDRIMLDNMSCEDMAACIERLRARGTSIETEASGTITEERIAEVARTGVDFISVGAITHSQKALDIHLLIL
ncbi:MAG: carboxylating nicotinate-nucleotide diphosphorylase [Chitinivibrionales bacterium]|nr:carboxylating nicotinate-nucleotide diphosphorylase [Chitinivibrionales bacterium]MBD3394949.1 carboxylating nicotinate-nucleotide diphosphorylase [Chitinivibrionales bacterium]